MRVLDYRVIDRIGKFVIGQTARDFVVIRDCVDDKHSHFNSLSGCHTCLDLIGKNKLPCKQYFRKAAKRLLYDEEYNGLMEIKKEYYININKGLPKR